jgi:hypothetical protein
MKNIANCKDSKYGIRFTKAIKATKKYTEEDWDKYSKASDAKGKDKIIKDRRSIYYSHPMNKFKDLYYRKNWKKKHPRLAKLY